MGEDPVGVGARSLREQHVLPGTAGDDPRPLVSCEAHYGAVIRIFKQRAGIGHRVRGG